MAKIANHSFLFFTLRGRSIFPLKLQMRWYLFLFLELTIIITTSLF